MIKLTKLLFRVAIIALALIGLGNVVWWLWPSSSAVPTTWEYLTSTPSPNGQYEAVWSTLQAGGAISPSCFDRITVVPVGTGADARSAEGMAVFEAECAPFPPKDGVIENSPRLHWESDTRLKVSFSIKNAVAFPAAVKLRTQDASRKIALVFEVVP